MAKRAPKAEEEPTEVRVRFEADPKPDTPFYYVNFASVSQTEYDFTLNFLRLPSHLSIEQIEQAKNGAPIAMEPVLQLIIPPRLVNGLIHALSVERDKYQRRYGSIKPEGKNQ